MLEPKKAAFSFESFKIPKFSYDEGNHLGGSKLKLGFLPTGRYNSKIGEFELILKFIAHDIDNQEKIIFELTSSATYKFDMPIAYRDIPSFFYQNAIAIMFPYVRAFISTATLQANTKLLKIGLMNLSNLEKSLVENTVEI